jgi:hypothetical protein
MGGRIDIVAIVVSVVLLAYVIEAVRRRKLREEYSILWLVTASVVLLLALVRPALIFIANAMGILTPVNALFVIGFAFTTLILLHFSTVISRLARENRDLAQRYALLVHRLEHEQPLARNVEQGSEPFAPPALAPLSITQGREDERP